MRRAISTCEQRVLRSQWSSLRSQIPPFLCPALFRQTSKTPKPSQSLQRHQPYAPVRRLAHSVASSDAALHSVAKQPLVSSEATLRAQRLLPQFCTGCGASSQTIAPKEAGYFDLERRQVKAYLKAVEEETSVPVADVADEAHQPPASQKEEEKTLDKPERKGRRQIDKANPPTPLICERCFALKHYNRGQSVIHPSVEALAETIADSPHERNYIYHIIDAADFPMSVIPGLDHAMKFSPLRTKNRRSKSQRFIKGRIAEVDFVITRSDLLLPKAGDVDKLMPYLQDVLRDALGRHGDRFRLGNVRCVSAHKGWWTTKLKEAIYERGGGAWMVGKVNVGKSSLFEVVFPKGRNQEKVLEQVASRKAIKEGQQEETSIEALETEETTAEDEASAGQERLDAVSAEDKFLLSESLLPPARTETAYPEMPLISTLPGTTAAPIRVPFGSSRGELVDLPGLPRSLLTDLYVQPQHRRETLMHHRLRPKRIVLAPGQSLLLASLIRITPQFPRDTTFLIHNFTTLKPHVAATPKTEAMQLGHRVSAAVPSIATPEAAAQIRSAGTFELVWDVTRAQAGPLTNPSAVGLKAEKLPFVVYSVDIVIEGMGWVEVVAQVRRREMEKKKVQIVPGGLAGEAGVGLESESENGGEEEKGKRTQFPTIEVFSPEGGFVAGRRPMGAWLKGGRVPKPKSQRTVRPRKSMKGDKKRRKAIARGQKAAKGEL